MKKIFLIAVLLIVFSVAIFAQQTCPDLNPQITDCQKQGLDPKYDQINDCKQVIGCCSNDYVKQDQDCRAKGGGSVLGVDSNSCTFLRECKMPTICTPLAEQRAACIATGRTVVEGTDWTNGCEQVKCRTCKTEEEINKEKESCDNSKGNFQKWQESDGCYSTSCAQSNPNMCDWVEKEKDRCKSNGGSPREVKNNYGGPSNCPMIVCDYPAGAEYSSKDKCESSTNCFCEYRDCNYVMQGTSYEDTCGKNFVPGWYCQIPKPSDGVIKCGGTGGGYYCPRGYHCDSSEWNKEGKCIKDENQQTSCYVRSDEDINREKQRCDQIGGKLEKREDHWSGAENCYSYRCISQDGKCGSSSMGMLDCPEGNYCEQPNYQGNYGSNYKQEYGKCISLNKQEICPLLDAKEKNKCANMGGSIEVKKNDKGCEYYECKQNKEFCGGIAGIQCLPGHKCELDGNYPDAGGKCVPEKKVCMKDEEVKTQVNKCTSNNSSPKISSEKGCVKEITCLTEQQKTPQKDLPPEEKKEQDITKLFNVAFKLEELRIQFDKLKKKTQNIADYYDQEGELEYADKFKKVSSLFDDALNRVDGIKSDLRNSIDKDLANEESMGNVKNSIQKLKENMKEILKELLR